MEYALKILNRCGSAVRPTRRPRFVDEVTCAYCGGGGGDPKYQSASGCPVCRGAGTVPVIPPVVTCRRCGGSGRVEGDLVCLTCRGVGAVSVPVGANTCSRCGGNGEEGVFYCNACKGKGSSDVARRQQGRIDMKINCLSCGFKVDLDDTYEDFEGPVKCICGALLEIRIEEGLLKGIRLVPPLHPKSKRMEGGATP